MLLLLLLLLLLLMLLLLLLLLGSLLKIGLYFLMMKLPRLG